MRLAFVSALVVVAAFVGGYATAGGGYNSAQPITPVPLTVVASGGSNGLALAKLTITSRLQPASRRANSVATVVQTPVVRQPVTPVVRQPVTPTRVQPQAPPSGGGTFDSSG